MKKSVLATLFLSAMTAATLVLPLSAQAKAAEPAGAPKHVGEAPVAGAPAPAPAPGGAHGHTGIPGA